MRLHESSAGEKRQSREVAQDRTLYWERVRSSYREKQGIRTALGQRRQGKGFKERETLGRIIVNVESRATLDELVQVEGVSRTIVGGTRQGP